MTTPHFEVEVADVTCTDSQVFGCERRRHEAEEHNRLVFGGGWSPGVSTKRYRQLRQAGVWAGTPVISTRWVAR